MTNEQKITFQDEVFTEEEFNEVLRAVQEVNPVFAFVLEGAVRYVYDDE